MISVEFHPSAVEDALAALAWYAERSISAGQAFERDLRHAVEAIAEAPERWPRATRGTRRFVMRRFPFIVVYVAVAQRVTILAVAHARRRPGFWRVRE